MRVHEILGVMLGEQKASEISIQWTKPNLEFEWQEVIDPNQRPDLRHLYYHLFPSFEEFTTKAKGGRKVRIDGLTLDNSDDSVDTILQEKLDRVCHQYEVGKVEMPLVVYVDGKYVLIGGNTRLNVGRELGLPVYGWVISMMMLGEQRASENDFNFRRWFGNSKVVDATGKPLRMYHGTTEQFNQFHPWSHFGSSTAANQRLNFRDTHGNEHIIPVYLRIEHPLKVTDQEASEEATLLNAIIRGEYKSIDINTARRQGVRRALMDAGYDGLVYRNRMEHRGRYSWVIFEPNQVKSAITGQIREWIDTTMLGESRRAALYHWMEGIKIENVLGSDMLQGRVIHPVPGMGDIKGVSLSRNKLFTFGDRGEVRLTMDQEKLATRFKLLPLDGEAAFRRHNELEPTVTDRGNTDREAWKFAEEFLVGDIPELHRYVTHIFIKQRSQVVPVKQYIACAEYSKRWSIPLITDPVTMPDDAAANIARNSKYFP